jgi:hypothetical protein
MDDPLLPAKRKRDQLDAPSGVVDVEEGARAARVAGCEQPGASSGSSPEAVTVALLSGHDDPCTNEQYTMWKERLFTDVWLQARHGQGATRLDRGALVCLPWSCHLPPHLTRHPPPCCCTTHSQAGHPGQPEGARVPGTRLLLASLSPYLKKLLVGSQQLRGLDGDTIFVDVPGGEHALALVVEARVVGALALGVGKEWHPAPGECLELTRCSLPRRRCTAVACA